MDFYFGWSFIIIIVPFMLVGCIFWGMMKKIERRSNGIKF
jgi:hypothetical protein